MHSHLLVFYLFSEFRTKILALGQIGPSCHCTVQILVKTHTRNWFKKQKRIGERERERERERDQRHAWTQSEPFLNLELNNEISFIWQSVPTSLSSWSGGYGCCWCFILWPIGLGYSICSCQIHPMRWQIKFKKQKTNQDSFLS